MRVSEASALDAVVARLPAGWQPRDAPLVDHLVSYVVGGESGRVRRLHLLYGDGRRLVRTTEAGEALAVLENHLTQAVAEMAPRRLFVHAGVVGWRGRAIVVPGPSRVHPFPRPLRLRDEREVVMSAEPERLGGARGVGPLPVALVAVARYDAGSRWRPARLTRGRALLELLSHTIVARTHPASAMATLRRVVTRAPSFKGRRGEARETAAWLLEAVS